jgi:hypothetical protein
MEREPHVVLGVSRFAAWADVRSAYRQLARRYHPDGTGPDPLRMSEVNAAYEALERRRRAVDGTAPPVAVGPGWDGPGSGMTAGPAIAGAARAQPPSGPPRGSLLWRVRHARHGESPMLDFGQYSGWRISEVADHDPRYLVWLSRHSSGVRFRRAIEEVLGNRADLGRPAAVLGN